MRVADRWDDFEILDASGGERLERWGKVLLIRPDPRVLWSPPRGPEWREADARYLRSSSGGGRWETLRPHPDRWTVRYGDLAFHIRPTGFKHTGLFPEQAVNWDAFRALIRAARRPVRVLCLFAYTGGATLACAAAGASVCHVDASGGVVAWARENQALSGLQDRPVRWIVDDCGKFVGREIRRGSFYDAVIMDPPSYGRGPGGEVWKLEDGLYGLVRLCVGVLSEHPLFFAVNSYTTGLSPGVMEYILGSCADARFPGRGLTVSSEIGLPVRTASRALPCGSTAIWRSGGADPHFL